MSVTVLGAEYCSRSEPISPLGTNKLNSDHQLEGLYTLQITRNKSRRRNFNTTWYSLGSQIKKYVVERQWGTGLGRNSFQNAFYGLGTPQTFKILITITLKYCAHLIQGKKQVLDIKYLYNFSLLFKKSLNSSWISDTKVAEARCKNSVSLSLYLNTLAKTWSDYQYRLNSLNKYFLLSYAMLGIARC